VKSSEDTIGDVLVVRSLARVGVEDREGKEGSLGWLLLDLLLNLLLHRDLLGISGDAAGLGLAGGTLGSQQIQRGYCFWLSVTL
jgi:hypothetical protein